jgi:hypothetical protein
MVEWLMRAALSMVLQRSRRVAGGSETSGIRA